MLILLRIDMEMLLVEKYQ